MCRCVDFGSTNTSFLSARFIEWAPVGTRKLAKWAHDTSHSSCCQSVEGRPTRPKIRWPRGLPSTVYCILPLTAPIDPPSMPSEHRYREGQCHDGEEAAGQEEEEGSP